jgi:hypothetical protein
MSNHPTHWTPDSYPFADVRFNFLPQLTMVLEKYLSKRVAQSVYCLKPERASICRLTLLLEPNAAP